MGVAFETDKTHPESSLTDQTKPDMPIAESRITHDAQNGAHAHNARLEGISVKTKNRRL